MTEKHVEPLPEGEYSAPLRYQLADFTSAEKFVWVDRCFKIARIWQPALALSSDWCLAMGQLAGHPSVMRMDSPLWKGKVQFRQAPRTMQTINMPWRSCASTIMRFVMMPTAFCSRFPAHPQA